MNVAVSRPGPKEKDKTASPGDYAAGVGWVRVRATSDISADDF